MLWLVLGQLAVRNEGPLSANWWLRRRGAGGDRLDRIFSIPLDVTVMSIMDLSASVLSCSFM